MCNTLCLEFIEKALSEEDVKGKDVLEVGLFDVNGSPRTYVESMLPSSYVGIDIAPGPGVDEVCDAENLLERFGEHSFDILISTEMIEHVANWKLIISNFKRVLRPGGIVIVTTRSFGFPLHDYPVDYWRFETHDMDVIFSDFTECQIESDQSEPGVFITARKPEQFQEYNFDGYALFSMITLDRSLGLDEAIASVKSTDETVLLREEIEFLTDELKRFQNLKILRFTSWIRKFYAKVRSENR